jgi:predicted O-methyltransferase YrrM
VYGPEVATLERVKKRLIRKVRSVRYRVVPAVASLRNRLRRSLPVGSSPVQNPAVAEVVTQLQDALGRGRRHLAPNELAVVDRIEQVRAQLLADTSEVEIVAYGAGSPEALRSTAEMASGVITHRTVAGICERAVSKPSKALGLFTVVRALRPGKVVELGTSLGISGSYLAGALSLNGHGRLFTFEGAPAIAAIAQRNLEHLGLSGCTTVVVGRFQDTLDQAMADSDPVDLVYIDGHHDRTATIEYVNHFAGLGRSGTVLVLDDIRWSAPMLEAWKTVSADARVAVALDMGRIGYLVLH